MRRSRRSAHALLCAAIWLAVATPAGALTIVPQLVAAGQEIPGTGITAGNAPGGTSGTGTLQAVFAAAAKMWEAVIGDTMTITLSFGWGARPGTTLAGTGISAEGGTPSRPTAAGIVFDNDGSTPWWLDGTPSVLDDDNFLRRSTTTRDLGGGDIGIGIVYSAPFLREGVPDPKDHYDLLTVVLHEIGHALGLSTRYQPFVDETADGEIDVTAPRPNEGTTIPMDDTHIRLAAAADRRLPLMYDSYDTGTRRLISTLDVLAVCQVLACGQPGPVPEPGPAWLLATGLAGLAGVRRRGRCGAAPQHGRPLRVS